MKARVYLHWGDGRRTQSQPPREMEVLRVRRGLVVVAGEHSRSGRSYYRLTDGRRCDGRGVAYPWDFWRLDVEEFNATARADRRTAP